MKISKEMRVYCPKCNKHTVHVVRIYSKKPSSGLSVRQPGGQPQAYWLCREGKGAEPLSQSWQKAEVLLECKECKRSIERVVGSRVKKKTGD